MNKELFREYAEVKGQIKLLSEKAKELEEKVSEEMRSNEAEKVESDFGKFFFVTRKKWTYSENVKLAEDNVKDLKKKEESSGEAMCEEVKSLTFRQ